MQSFVVHLFELNRTEEAAEKEWNEMAEPSDLTKTDGPIAET